ncbi:MAG: methyltransferase domain-containing protein [Phycisphaeraceae bacterium]
MPSSTPCRLCRSEAQAKFALTVLGKHRVWYFECTNCQSLQSEEPHWLNEAYANATRPLDLGTAKRALWARTIIFFLWRLFSLPKDGRLVDWGGGDGLLVRLLRDTGINALLADKYTDNTYAIGFDDDGTCPVSMITAFEVWEHLADPASEIAAGFARKPHLYLLSTTLYNDDDDKWPYLAPNTGRHVFFYSRRAMSYIAVKYGYQSIAMDTYTLFYKSAPQGRISKALLKWLMRNRYQRAKDVLFALARKGRRPEDTPATVHERLTERHAAEQ